MSSFPARNLDERLRLACVLEATARKAGNVHPLASFADLTCADFIASARIAAPLLTSGCENGLGRAVLDAVVAVRESIGSNSNLGIVLLLAPLAIAAGRRELTRDGVERVLSSLTPADADRVYEAIRRAHPGGLGTAPEQDVSLGPTIPLREAMALAADRDLVARQYANGFAEVFGIGRTALLTWAERTQDWEGAIIGAQLEIMAALPDSLIARKLGSEVATESAERARRVLDAARPEGEQAAEFGEFDRWLRADGHRRNPGTTADLIAAILFVVLEQGTWPFDLPWSPPTWAEAAFAQDRRLP